MNRKEMNEALSILNLSNLLLGYKEEDDETETLAFQVSRIPQAEHRWFCEGTAEGWKGHDDDDQVGCDQPAQWIVDSQDDFGPQMYCSACLVDLIGPNGKLKVIAGEVLLDNQGH